MRTRSPVRRIVLGLFAVVHLSVPTLAAVVHAWQSQASAVDEERVHVEDLGRRHSVPTHPESCVLCQMLGREMLAAAERVAWAEGTAGSETPPHGRRDVHSRTATAGPSSRAPPTQS